MSDNYPSYWLHEAYEAQRDDTDSDDDASLSLCGNQPGFYEKDNQDDDNNNDSRFDNDDGKCSHRSLFGLPHESSGDNDQDDAPEYSQVDPVEYVQVTMKVPVENFHCTYPNDTNEAKVRYEVRDDSANFPTYSDEDDIESTTISRTRKHERSDDSDGSSDEDEQRESNNNNSMRSDAHSMRTTKQARTTQGFEHRKETHSMIYEYFNPFKFLKKT